MNDFNIEKYSDVENVTIAEFTEAIAKSETMIHQAIKNKNVKGTLNAIKLNAKLNKLLNKKTSLGAKDDYNSKGYSK